MRSFSRKRLFDLAITLPALIVTAPAQLVIAGLIARMMGRPVLFRQTRPGLHGAPFELIKFRTMRPLDVTRGWLDDATRLTRLGRILRATSLDELPTLWNVARGDMSLVGPRPLLMEYLDRYTPEQARRHEALPGLTGLAQVSGRNSLSWEEKFHLDLQYVDHQSMWLDLRVLVKTVSVVLKRRGISAPDSATMPVFQGASTGPQR